jgi:MFS family permease
MPPERASLGLLAVLLAALAMIGPFAVDIYLPSFPAIQRDLRVSAIEVQQTWSVYLLRSAVMTLSHGTISDSFGRRPVILPLSLPTARSRWRPAWRSSRHSAGGRGCCMFCATRARVAREAPGVAVCAGLRDNITPFIQYLPPALAPHHR